MILKRWWICVFWVWKVPVARAWLAKGSRPPWWTKYRLVCELDGGSGPEFWHLFMHFIFYFFFLVQGRKGCFQQNFIFSAWTEYHAIVIIFFHSFLNIFCLYFLHKKIMEQYTSMFSPRDSTQQVFIKVLYNVQTFTSTVPTECRRYHRDFRFFKWSNARPQNDMELRCKKVKKLKNPRKQCLHLQLFRIHPCKWSWCWLPHRKPCSTFNHIILLYNHRFLSHTF